MRIQMTGNVVNGELESYDPDAQSGVQTKADADALRATGPNYGAVVNPHPVGVQRLQVGAEAAEEAQAEAAQIRVEEFVVELDRLQSVASAGRTIDSKTIESLQHRLNDTAIAYVRAGGGVNDDTLVQLRQMVDNISYSARINKR